MATKLTAAERSAAARIAVHKSWSNTEDPSARTAPARAARARRREEHRRKADEERARLAVLVARRHVREAADELAEAEQAALAIGVVVDQADEAEAS